MRQPTIALRRMETIIIGGEMLIMMLDLKEFGIYDDVTSNKKTLRHMIRIV